MRKRESGGGGREGEGGNEGREREKIREGVKEKRKVGTAELEGGKGGEKGPERGEKPWAGDDTPVPHPLIYS